MSESPFERRNPEGTRERGRWLAGARDPYRVFFESLDEGFCVLEVLRDESGGPRDYRFLATNDAFGRLTGLADAEGRRMRTLDPGLEEHWFETFDRIARTGRAEQFTLPARRFGGRWYEIQAARIGTPEQGRVGVLFRDVTERRRTEERLLRNQAKQALLLRISDALRGLHDPVEIQEVAARLLGEHMHAHRVYYAEVDEASGVIRVEVGYARPGASLDIGLYRYDAFDWVGPTFRGGAPAVLDDVRTSPLVPDEQRAILEVYEARAILAVPLLKENRLVAALAIDDSVPRAWTPDELDVARETAERTWDAVARARAETDLRRSEGRTRLALEASGMGSFIWYPEEDLGEMDARAAELIGYRPPGRSSIEGLLDRVVHDEDRERLERSVRRALDSAGSGTVLEEVLIRRRGTERWVSLRAQVTFSEDPAHPTYVAGVVSDVTDRRRREQELLEARQAAQAANEAKSGFVATVSHELRTPLNAIIGYADLLLQDIGEPLGARARHHVVRLDHGARHLKSIIEDVLTFSRLEAGRESVREEESALGDIVDELHSVVDPLVRDRPLAFQADYEGRPERIRTDVGKLRQILLNLLGNAAKFTERGTIGLRIRPGGPAGIVHFEVWDTGPGIAPDVVTELFEPFAQGSGTQVRMGTGLGLTISRRLARLLGGDLTLELDAEEGSCFRLVLPGGFDL